MEINFGEDNLQLWFLILLFAIAEPNFLEGFDLGKFIEDNKKEKG